MAAQEYQRVGAGEHVVIALHGWFGSAKAWAPLWPHLDTSRFSYVFPDYRGYGSRRGVPGEHTMAELAADTLVLADELGLDRISPGPASGVPFDEQGWQLFSGAAAQPANRRAIIDLTTGNRLSGTWLDAMVAHSLAHSDTDAFSDYLTAWAKTDFHADIEGSDVPVKVIVGEHDPALGEQTARATFQQWYPKLDLEVFPNAGHYAMDETPVALATAIERFLASV